MTRAKVFNAVFKFIRGSNDGWFFNQMQNNIKCNNKNKKLKSLYLLKIWHKKDERNLSTWCILLNENIFTLRMFLQQQWENVLATTIGGAKMKVLYETTDVNTLLRTKKLPSSIEQTVTPLKDFHLLFPQIVQCISEWRFVIMHYIMSEWLFGWYLLSQIV